MESAPGRRGPAVEFPATGNCLLGGSGVLPVRDRWHLARFNALLVAVVLHMETFKSLPATEIGHPVM